MATATSFNFDQRTLEVLDELKKEFNASSRAEVLRKAIALLDLARKAREQGGGVLIETQRDGERERERVLL